MGAAADGEVEDYVFVISTAINTESLVSDEHKSGMTSGNFGGVLDANDQFGTSIASLGDLDGDGVTDIVVGANQDDDGGSNRGAIWVLFMNADGTVRRQQKISSTSGGFYRGTQ